MYVKILKGSICLTVIKEKRSQNPLYMYKLYFTGCTMDFLKLIYYFLLYLLTVKTKTLFNNLR